MRLIRVAILALLGLLLIFIAVQSTMAALRDYVDPTVQAMQAGLVPGAIGALLLLVALAMSRRSRLGYLAGLITSGLLALSGLAVVVIELGYLDDGGLGGALAGAFIVVGAVWTLFWLFYLWSIRRDRPAFASDWGPADRRFGIAIGGLVAFSVAAYLALAAINSSAVAEANVDEARAQELVNGTAIQAHVVNASFATAPGESAQTASHLTLELRFQGAEAYALAAAPTVCLTDMATHLDPAYKPDTFCWGSPGPAVALADGFGDLTMPSTERSIRLDLDRGPSRCAFAAGPWNAEVTLAPALTTTRNVGPAPARFVVNVQFEIESPGGPPQSGGDGTGACIASIVSA